MKKKILNILEIPDGKLDKWLKAKESAIPGIRPDTEKIIYWSNKPDKKTPLSIIYIHGFSATRQELVPVFDKVAEKLNANIFYTRLKGHGRDGEVMKDATLEDWKNDVVEAWEIGRKIGEKVIVTGMSTGAPLAAWLCTQVKETACLIMLSPNFDPANTLSNLILWPGRKLLIRLLVGKYNEFKTENEQQKKYWTSRYRAEALIPMMKAVRLGQKSNLKSLKLPVLCVYSENDKVISIPRALEIFNRIGSSAKSIINLKESTGHGLAGDILSPHTTEELISVILKFLSTIGLLKGI